MKCLVSTIDDRPQSNFSVMATRLTSKRSVTGAVSWLICPLLRVRADLSLYLHHSEDSTPSEPKLEIIASGKHPLLLRFH